MSKSNKLWGGRFEKDTASTMANLSKSTHFDWRLATFDLLQTDVHVQSLNRSKLLSDAETKQIRSAIKDIHNKVSSGALRPNDTDEDVHTAIERLIIESVGEIGGKNSVLAVAENARALIISALSARSPKTTFVL